MKNLYNISLMGENRLGFVSTFLKKLFIVNANVLTSSMNTIGDKYNINLQTEFPDGIDMGQFLKHNLDPKVSYIYSSSRDDMSIYRNFYPFSIKMSLSDTSGIIYATTQELSNINVHIDSLSTNITNAPICSTPLFNLETKVMVPNIQHPEIVKKSLLNVKDKFDCDISYKYGLLKNWQDIESEMD